MIVRQTASVNDGAGESPPTKNTKGPKMNQISEYSKHYQEENFKVAVDYYLTDLSSIVDFHVLNCVKYGGAREAFDSCQCAFMRSAVGKILKHFEKANNAVCEYENAVLDVIENGDNDDEKFWDEFNRIEENAKRCVSLLPMIDWTGIFEEAVSFLVDEFDRNQCMDDATIYSIDGWFVVDYLNEYKAEMSLFEKILEFDAEQFVDVNSQSSDDVFNDMFAADKDSDELTRLPVDLICEYCDWKKNRSDRFAEIWRNAGIVTE